MSVLEPFTLENMNGWVQLEIEAEISISFPCLPHCLSMPCHLPVSVRKAKEQLLTPEERKLKVCEDTGSMIERTKRFKNFI